MSREDMTFDSSGQRCAAWLYRPDGGSGDVPCVVMGHGFSATRHERMPAFAERFAAAGFAALCFDYRYFGDSEGEPRQLVDIAAQQADWKAAIAFARSLDGVDPARIALWGSSFSGGHVLAVAADDPRLAAVISQVPFTDGPATVLALGPRAVISATPAAILDTVRGLLGRSPKYIPAVGPPGTVGMMTTADSEPGFRRIIPPESTWENRVSARTLMRVPLYRPGRRAKDIRAPLFMAVASGDSLTPADTAAKWGATAPDHELLRLDCGHFDPYVGELFEQLVEAETAFLARTLTTAAAIA